MPGTLTLKPILAKLNDSNPLGQPTSIQGQDSYCVAIIGNQFTESGVCPQGGNNPKWNDSLYLQRKTDEPYCFIEIKDKNTMKDTTVGVAAIDLDDLQNGGESRRWYELFQNRQSIGGILVEAQLQTDEFKGYFTSEAGALGSRDLDYTKDAREIAQNYPEALLTKVTQTRPLSNSMMPTVGVRGSVTERPNPLRLSFDIDKLNTQYGDLTHLSTHLDEILARSQQMQFDSQGMLIQRDSSLTMQRNDSIRQEGHIAKVPDMSDVHASHERFTDDLPKPSKTELVKSYLVDQLYGERHYDHPVLAPSDEPPRESKRELVKSFIVDQLYGERAYDHPVLAPSENLPKESKREMVKSYVKDQLYGERAHDQPVFVPVFEQAHDFEKNSKLTQAKDYLKENITHPTGGYLKDQLYGERAHDKPVFVPVFEQAHEFEKNSTLTQTQNYLRENISHPVGSYLNDQLYGERYYNHSVLAPSDEPPRESKREQVKNFFRDQIYGEKAYDHPVLAPSDELPKESKTEQIKQFFRDQLYGEISYDHPVLAPSELPKESKGELVKNFFREHFSGEKAYDHPVLAPSDELPRESKREMARSFVNEKIVYPASAMKSNIGGLLRGQYGGEESSGEARYVQSERKPTRERMHEFGQKIRVQVDRARDGSKLAYYDLKEKLIGDEEHEGKLVQIGHKIYDKISHLGKHGVDVSCQTDETYKPYEVVMRNDMMKGPITRAVEKVKATAGEQMDAFRARGTHLIERHHDYNGDVSHYHEERKRDMAKRKLNEGMEKLKLVAQGILHKLDGAEGDHDDEDEGHRVSKREMLREKFNEGLGYVQGMIERGKENLTIKDNMWEMGTSTDDYGYNGESYTYERPVKVNYHYTQHFGRPIQREPSLVEKLEEGLPMGFTLQDEHLDAGEVTLEKVPGKLAWEEVDRMQEGRKMGEGPGSSKKTKDNFLGERVGIYHSPV